MTPKKKLELLHGIGNDSRVMLGSFRFVFTDHYYLFVQTRMPRARRSRKPPCFGKLSPQIKCRKKIAGFTDCTCANRECDAFKDEWAGRGDDENSVVAMYSSLCAHNWKEAIKFFAKEVVQCYKDINYYRTTHMSP